MKRVLILLLATLMVCCCWNRRNTNSTTKNVDIEEDLIEQEDTVSIDEMTILNSDDGKVTVYGWEKPHTGTMGSYGSRVEYKWEGKTMTQELFESDDDFAPLPKQLYTLNDGKYIMYQYFREWSSLGYIGATAYELTKDGLTEIKLFETPEGLDTEIGLEFVIPDWYFRAGDGEGYDWLYYFNKDEKTLYHPLSLEGDILTDRYVPYKWNGKTMVPGAEVGNPFLYESLSEYVSLAALFHTQRNLVRIDEMPDGCFRYAAWPKKGSMLDKPELVILGGTSSEDDSEWVFCNEGYEYHYNGEDLYVMKGKKKVSSWKKLR